MKLPLLPFQTEAVSDVIEAMGKATKVWSATRDYFDPQRTAFALSSVTGSGKTVIAATVIEAILSGSITFNQDPVPGSTVLWLNYDPALNSQTLGVFKKFADRIAGTDLVIIDNTFSLDRLEAGKVYFLSLNLLGSNGKLTKPAEHRSHTFWDTLSNTIRDDDLMLYVVVDEAHVGMKEVTANENRTILQRVIAGDALRPGVPVLWGISATPQRFRTTISNMLPGAGGTDVRIDPADVQGSGLLKQQVSLYLPGESVKMWTTLLGEAIADLNESTKAWADYCQDVGRPESVVPLLVIQLPDRQVGSDTSAEDRQIAEITARLSTDIDGFTPDCIAHVLGDRSTIETKAAPIPKVEPDTVADATRIRVLLAKESISAGWDCPRAEVLLSLRPLKDETAITQMLGRMVRTPLAKTTEVERLDLVSCYVPYFDAETAQKVVEMLTGDREPDGREKPSLKTNINPVMLGFNPLLGEEVRGALATLPSVLPPQAKPRPVSRLKILTSLMSEHGIGQAPIKASHTKICDFLDGKAIQYAQQVADARADVLTASVTVVSKRFGTEAVTDNKDVEADLRTVRESFNAANRALSGLGLTYYKHLRAKTREAGQALDERELRANVAAIGLVPQVIKDLESFCDQYVDQLFQTYQDDINLLSKEAQSDFVGVKKQARDPQGARIEFKTEKSYGTTDVSGTKLGTAGNHIYADAEGNWPVEESLSKNAWESAVLTREVARDAVKGWYRNPSAAGSDSFRIAFESDGRWRTFQPDFIFVEQTADGLRAAIVDPHFTLDKDALARIKALARYAEEHAGLLTRVDALADPKNSGVLRRLRLTDPDVRERVLVADSAVELYLSDAAENYGP